MVRSPVFLLRLFDLANEQTFVSSCLDNMTKLTVDDLAFQAVFNDHFKSLLFSAYKLVKNWDVAQCIVTDAFVGLRRNNIDFTDKNIVRLLYTAVRRACIARRRRRQRVEWDREELIRMSSYLKDDEEWMKYMVFARLGKALDSLSVEERAIIIGYSLTEKAHTI